MLIDGILLNNKTSLPVAGLRKASQLSFYSTVFLSRKWSAVDNISPQIIIPITFIRLVRVATGCERKGSLNITAKVRNENPTKKPYITPLSKYLCELILVNKNANIIPRVPSQVIWVIVV